MLKNLVIVESPAKAKTITKFLGKNFVVKASMGHIRDLPRSKLGVDIEADFKPHYIVIRSRSKVIKELKAAAAKAEAIYLAPDPDREGEAIAWHLQQELNHKGKSVQVYRIMFNEITQRAVQEALENPREIDQKMVDAQQARRILDRLVGYSLSPLLWKKVRKGLSAGRVQSVAVRLVVIREREIKVFKPEEYWKIEVDLETGEKQALSAQLFQVEGQKAELHSQTDSQKIVALLSTAEYWVASIEKKEQRRFPAPPFITSKLQQEAASKLHFTGKKTMMVAQQLYEGVELSSEGPVGLITYMRTDSVRVNAEAQNQARDLIKALYGEAYLPETPPKYKSKRIIQDAHEAIRPTTLTADKSPEHLKKYLTSDQFKLYRLIWQRFFASQMNPAVMDATTIEIQAGVCTLKATGSVMKFKGFTSVYTETREEEEETKPGEEKTLPPLVEQQPLFLVAVRPEQKFTQPPARYNDATLVKALEENNIGRPSTYVPIISTILDRDYIERRESRFYPTELGIIINDLLVESFPDILDVEFTASMENQLDEIETGKIPWVEVLRTFYGRFQKDLEKARLEMTDIKSTVEVKLAENCEKCGAPLTVKWGRHGKFIACSNYPACRNTKALEQNAEGKIVVKAEEIIRETCELCGSPLQIKYSRFGKFLACSRYPACTFKKSILKEIGMACPKPGCQGKIIERRSKRGRNFYGCSRYPACHFVSWDKPLPEPCPQCGNAYLVQRYSKKDGWVKLCPAEGCGFRKSEPADMHGEEKKT